MKFNSQTEKEIKEISITLELLTKKQKAKETLTQEEINKSKLDVKHLTKIIKTHPEEVKSSYDNVLKKIPKELADKVQKKIGTHGIAGFIDKVNNHIKPDEAPVFDIACFAFCAAVLAGQLEFLPFAEGFCAAAMA